MVFAEYFDILGFITFSFLTILGIWMLSKKKLPSKEVIYILITIGIVGLIIDGYIVISTFILP